MARNYPNPLDGCHRVGHSADGIIFGSKPVLGGYRLCRDLLDLLSVADTNLAGTQPKCSKG